MLKVAQASTVRNVISCHSLVLLTVLIGSACVLSVHGAFGLTSMGVFKDRVPQKGKSG